MKNRSFALGLAAALLAGGPLGVRAQIPSPLVPPPPPPPPIDNGGTPGGAGPNVVPGGGAPGNGGGGPVLPGNPIPAGPIQLEPVTSGLTLRYKFTPGMVLYYKVSLDSDGALMTGPSEGTPMRQHVDMALHQTVLKVRDSDGAGTLTTQIDSVSVTRNGQAVTLPAKTAQQIKQAFTTVVATSGRVLSSGAPAVAGTAGIPGLSVNPLDFQGLIGLSANPTLQIVNLLPDNSLSTSDTWRSNYTAPSGSPEEHTASTLSSAVDVNGNTLVTIGQKVYAEFKAPKAGTTASGDTHMTGLITGAGQEQFDVNIGAINSQTSTLQINLKETPAKSGETVTANIRVKETLTRVTEDGSPVVSDTVKALIPQVAPKPPADEPPTNQLQ